MLLGAELAFPLIDHIVADDTGEGRVRVGALEPGVGDEAVGRHGEVDAVPADVRVGVVAHRGAGQPARRAHVVVVRAAAAAARPQGAPLIPCITNLVITPTTLSWAILFFLRVNTLFFRL